MNVKPPARMCGVRFIGSKVKDQISFSCGPVHRFKDQMRVEKGDPVHRFQRSNACRKR